MNNTGQKLEMVANVAIIVVAILFGVVIVRDNFPSRQIPSPSRPSEINVGSIASIAGIAKTAGQKTLLLVLNTDCHFCQESAPFYQRLAALAKSDPTVKLLAVFPQSESEGRAFLTRYQAGISDVRHMGLTSIPVAGTPTLLLLDPSQKVLMKWNGKLDPMQEDQVIKAVFGSKS